MRANRLAAARGFSPREVSIAVLAAGLGALGIAYFAEYALHMIPCPLCYIERWPYRIIVVLGLVAAFAPPRFARVLLGLAMVAMLGDVVIAFVHVGAEQHWWKSPLPECNIAPAGFGAMPLRPSASCDDPVYLIPGLPISFATMDLIYALTVAVGIGTYLRVNRWRA
ncbi:disulfide bond formation protein B [Acidiphilium sp.]|uniref:disulfide bond formation protein B n=1 Tax=Acidiphilium sp. TaxID=527 RepID=UPI003D034AC9